MCRDSDAVMRRVRRLENDVASNLMHWNGFPTAAESISELLAPERREGASRDRKNLVADEVKTNAGGRTLIEVQRIYSFDDVPAEFVPRISLCKDAFRKALGAVAAVGLLHHVEHQFVHEVHHSRLGSAHLPRRFVMSACAR